MSKFTGRLFLLFLLACLGNANADNDYRAYLSELLAHESKQALRPDVPYRYIEGEQGEKLRKLLAPPRIKSILSANFESILRGDDPPEVVKQLQPMLKRYDKAFSANPQEFEAEYLDTLEITVLVVQNSSRVPTPPKTPASGPDAELALTFGRLLEGAQELIKTVSKILGSGIRAKVSKGMFTEAGAKRALSLAFSIDGVAASSGPATGQLLLPMQTRPILDGSLVYTQACAECHSSGIAGAPLLSDRKAWAPRLKSGLPALLRATLLGKGPMPAMGGTYFDNIEIERAVVFLANSSGGNFVEPQLPVGHSGAVTVIKRPPPAAATEVTPYAKMTPREKLAMGEVTYVVNCAPCHLSTGGGWGPISSLHHAKSYSNNDSAITVLLNGSPNGAMPAWKFFSDEQIAEVINYSRTKFDNPVQTLVLPEEVRSFRNKK